MNEIKQILKSELFLISTDTVAGVGGILNDEVKNKIIKLKKIKGIKKFAILVADIDQAKKFSEWNSNAEKIANQYWPGALSIALDTYALRMPNCKKITDLLKIIGPIYLSSANLNGEKPMKYKEAKIAFKNKVKIHLNYSPNSSELSSTVIKATNMQVLRQGDVKINNMKTIYLASDHAGYYYKEEIKKHLKGKNYNIEDLGTNSKESVNYAVFGKSIGKKISEHPDAFGIAICGSGIGISIAANRFKHARAARVVTQKWAKLARRHNDANILALGERAISLTKAIKIVDAFLNEEFEGGRHIKRVESLG